eukprot:1289171-Alexandrium_andersonii.AAC.1
MRSGDVATRHGEQRSPELSGALRSINMRNCLRCSKIKSARAPKWPRKWPPKLPRGAFCAVFRADAKSADEAGRRARRRRFSG